VLPRKKKKKKKKKAKPSLTLVSHEIGKIPDELSDHIFFALLIQNQMVLLKQTLLVLLTEHQRWVLHSAKGS
jgi:hypothetical protein